MRTDRILALADLIEKQPHTNDDDAEGFTMGVYFHNCGTPSCIAGWAMAMEFNDYSEKLRRKAEKSFGDACGPFEDRIPGNFLGITPRQEGELFAPRNRSDITPTQAAATLRRLAETGEVKWEVE